MLKNNMDTSVNPCDDFYQFTCGNYVKRVKVPSDQSAVSQFKSLDKTVRSQLADYLAESVKGTDVLWIKNAKKFYSSCVNLDMVNRHTVLSAKEIFDTVGGWPLLTGKPNNLSPVRIMSLLSDYQFSPFAVITVMPNPKDPMKYIVKVYQPDYNPKELYEQEAYASAYKSYFKTVLYIMNSLGQVNDSDIDDIYELQKKLASIQMTLSERKNGTRNVEYTVADLQNKLPNFPWIDLISSSGIFSNVFMFKVDEFEPVSVDDWDYLVKMQDIYMDYADNKPEVLKNYLIANFFYSTLNDLMPVKFLEAKLRVSKFLTGASTLEDRKMFCVSKAQNYIPNEVGKLYVTKHFKKSAKTDASTMTKSILAEFKDMLKDLTWMDEESKQKAREKADFIKPQIGYPDNYDSTKYLEMNYNYYLQDYDFLSNVIGALQYSQRSKILGVLRSPVDRNEWFATPAIVNAFYEPSNNQIYFPAGILNLPFYHPDLPKYINYGAIGTVIGHEITHGFDDEGRHYDKYGRYYSDTEEGLWSKSTINTFKTRVQCMIDQYSGYLVDQINMTVNGYQTLGENIADNGGIKEAYKAYKKWIAANPTKQQPLLPGLDYNQDQLFFIGLAQVWCSKYKNETMTNLVLTNAHSPPEFRVIGMSQNSDDFQRVFKCTKPPAKKCTVW